MSTGVTTVIGHAPIPGGGFAGYGDATSRRRFGNFAGSSELVTIVRQALVRLQNAADQARAACEDRGYAQRAFEWLTNTAFSDSICDRADQLQLDLDVGWEKVADPNTTDQQFVDFLRVVNGAVDISDLLDLAESTSIGYVLPHAVAQAPGTAIGWTADAAGEIGRGIASAIPWWIWVIGAGVVASELGLLNLRRRS